MITREWLLSRPHSGKYKCPVCSHTRKNKNDKSLSITIKTEGVVCYCHHCNYTKGEYYDKWECNKLGREKRNKQGNSATIKSKKWSGPVW